MPDISDILVLSQRISHPYYDKNSKYLLSIL